VGVLHATAFPIVLGAILGAGIGNKMVFWLEHPHLWSNYQDNPLALLMGQSIVGGLLGGWIGVEIGKLIAKESSRTGNDFIRPILYGILIGRIGCFLAGLHDGTYGIATRLPWGIDFGDGIKRHPTQIYEWLLACITLITYPRWKNYFVHEAGLSFRLLMLAYLSWRFVSEYLKPLPYEYSLGLGGIQIVCVIAIIIIVLFTFVLKKINN
jgi:prolipoprotein diacylglyceryltransferase